MKQLSGLDSAFLDVENDHQFTHVSQLLILRRPGPEFAPDTVWRRRLAARLPVLEPLRRRLVEVPFGLDHPYWVSDPDVDLGFHVRHVAVPPPGTGAQLDELVGRLVAAPLDRDRPLWVSYVIEGLAEDRFAILTSIHHSTLDGAAGAELLARMLDTTSDAAPDAPADSPTETGTDTVAAEEPPSTAGVLGRAALHALRQPGRGLLLAARAGQSAARASRHPAVIDLADRVRGGLRGSVSSVLNLGREHDPDLDLPRLPPLVAPSTPFNATISRYRSVVHRTVSLTEVKAVGKATDASVNDVVVALCGGGLRRWLQDRGELPATPLTALIPVSLRRGDEPEPWTNRVSGTVAALPTDVDGPLARLHAARDALDTAKGVFAALPGELAPEVADIPPLAMSALTRAVIRWTTTAAPAFNVVISNVPGPREPLYLAGAELEHYVPVSTVADGIGLNMTVQSYVDRLDVGLMACAQLVPDLAELADAVVAELAALRAELGHTAEESGR